MRIFLLEPFYTGSHRTWAEQLAQHSHHEIHILKMEGRYWKWRMHGAAITMARKLKSSHLRPDLLLASDMLDVSTFLGLIRGHQPFVPLAIYFHENQMAYPWSYKATRNNNWRHFAFINLASALSADRVFFNSHYNLASFQQEAYQLLNQYPDYNETDTVDSVRHKSQVLPLGLNLSAFDPYLEDYQPACKPPLILWNHRWEHDKNPEAFTQLIHTLEEEGFSFELALLGEAPYGQLQAFENLKALLGNKMVQYGYADDFETYASWLAQADLLPVTSNQDFFGGSVIEAMYCGVYPLLPNRLAYPEHIPSGKEAVLYDTFEELVSKARQALNNIEQTRNFSLREHVALYDWRHQGPVYDRVLRSCLPAKPD